MSGYCGVCKAPAGDDHHEECTAPVGKPHRNTQERKDMLRRRAYAQRTRTPGFTPMHRKPPGYVSGKWDPKGEKVES